jgi:hypothetical protein
MGALIDGWMPACDVREYHEVFCRSSAERTYEAMRGADLAQSATVRWLFRLRGIAQSRATLEDLERFGFTLLDERPGAEVVLGLVGRFWRPTGGLEKVTAREFRAYDRPGIAKTVWNFRVEDTGSRGSRLSTETRVRCTDDVARRSFRRYWRLIGPFSGYIRTRMLATIKQEAEF